MTQVRKGKVRMGPNILYSQNLHGSKVGKYFQQILKILQMNSIFVIHRNHACITITFNMILTYTQGHILT